MHQFHIPVLGLAFSIDSPIKVAHLGISSVVSLSEDRLIEMMRKYYAEHWGKEFLPIGSKEENARARRIETYLNLMHEIVQTQFEKLKSQVFHTDSELDRYFQLLPSSSKWRAMYWKLADLTDKQELEKLAMELKNAMKPGRIDVNIMTKLDRDKKDKEGNAIADESEGVAALRGYALSKLNNSALVFSAGMNPRVFNALSHYHDFDMNEEGECKKTLIIKVSDYRSALIQGKYLAKKGFWVSEFRLESGLNCGGHAFATEGMLMGPILEEFRANRESMRKELFEMYRAALVSQGKVVPRTIPEQRIAAQGGIGTFEESSFLMHHYGLDSIGWGTPFLLVPEATTVDDDTLQQLCKAKEKDVVLSKNSPLGIRFYYLKGSTAELEKQARIEKGKPGSPCTEKHLAFNTEFTSEPICTASHQYQKLKLNQIDSLEVSEEHRLKMKEEVLAKECLCLGLSNSAAKVYDETFIKNLKAISICPGPNIAYFTEVVSLNRMVDHIYGRDNLLKDADRSHVFINELFIYLAYLNEKVGDTLLAQTFLEKEVSKFIKNLKEGIAYYESLKELTSDPAFSQQLAQAKRQLQTTEAILYRLN